MGENPRNKVGAGTGSLGEVEESTEILVNCDGYLVIAIYRSENGSHMIETWLKIELRLLR